LLVKRPSRAIFSLARATGATAYYWNPPNRDIAAGFTLGREALGPDYGAAIERARTLNAHL
jgi:hypothetical protein